MKYFASIFVLLMVLQSCDPSRHEMPITTSSEEARIMFLEGRKLTENFKWEEADTLYKLALELDPDFALAHLFKENWSGFDRALPFVTQTSIGESLYIRAVESFWAGNFEWCYILLDSLIDIYPRDKHCLLLAGKIYSTLDTTKALYLFQQALFLDLYYGAAYGNMGLLYQQSGNFKKAQETYEEYLDMLPGTVTAHEILATLFIKTDQIEQAVDQFKHALAIDPDYVSLYYRIAWMYIRLEEYEQAMKYCQSLYNREAKYGNENYNIQVALQMMAGLQYVQGDIFSALEIINQLKDRFLDLNDQPVYYHSLLLKGWYEMEGGFFEKARSTLSEAIQEILESNLEPQIKMSNIFILQGTLSLAYLRTGDKVNADKLFHEASESFDHSVNSQRNQRFMKLFDAIFAIHRDDYEYAISLLKLPADRLSVFCQYNLARAYELSDSLDLAIKYYRATSNSTDPRFAGFFYKKSLAKLQELIGR